MMMHLLKVINNWCFLQNIKGYCDHNDNVPKYHYVTIKKNLTYGVNWQFLKMPFQIIKIMILNLKCVLLPLITKKDLVMLLLIMRIKRIKRIKPSLIDKTQY
jgi:hypothetical protein